MKESEIFNEHDLTEKVHYVYRVIIDGYYYIGKRTGFLDDLITGRYKTSSKLIHEKLRNGLYFSKIKIIKVFSTEKEALEFEKRILLRVDARRNPKFLNQTNGGKDFCFKQHTQKTKEKLSKSHSKRWDENTEQGRRNREIQSNKREEFFNTEQGRKNKEKQSQSAKVRFDENTEQGRKNKENHSEIMKEFYNTKEGIKKKENHSEIMTEFFNPNAEQGRKNLEKAKVFRQKGVKTQIQNRKNVSILGDLMFDEEFIRENFLITDDKNNQRFLSSVYSKLSGYCMSHICVEKREGKLRFLYGIKSIIKITEEQENAKIKEIKAIIKSRNEKE